MDRSASTLAATRRVIAQIRAHREGCDPIRLADRLWPGDAPLTIRAGVAGTTSTTWSVTSNPAVLLTASVPDSVLGKIGVRQVPPNIPILAPDANLTASWVAESQSIPASRMSLASHTLRLNKIARTVPVTNEALNSASYSINQAIRDDLQAAITAALDQGLLDPNADGTGGAPPSITNGAPSAISSGDPRLDVLTHLSIFPGLSTRAFLITDAANGAKLNLWTDSSGSRFVDAGARGGSIAGIPLITSDFCPTDSSGSLLIMVDGARIAAAISDAEFSASPDTLFEQDSAPTGASDAPTASSSTLVSAFQEDLTVIKCVLRVDWKVMMPAVSVITGCNYA